MAWHRGAATMLRDGQLALVLFSMICTLMLILVVSSLGSAIGRQLDILVAEALK
jgi:hypothetical protein